MTTYQQILIILDNFEINFKGAFFPPGTALEEEKKRKVEEGGEEIVEGFFFINGVF